MTWRLAPALASATAITFLLLLALPMMAVRGKPEPEAPDLRATKLFFADAPRWQRSPEPQRVEHERFDLKRLDVSSRMPSRPIEGFLVPEPSAVQGPGLALDLGLETEALGGLSLGDITFEAAQVDEPPRVIRQTPPEYPVTAQRKGLTGLVELRFLVERDGSVGEVRVISAAPEGLFENSAVRAVKSWRFTPGMYRGEPVRTWVRIPIAFELE